MLCAVRNDLVTHDLRYLTFVTDPTWFRELLSTVPSSTPKPSMVIGLSSQVLVEASATSLFNTQSPEAFVLSRSVGYLPSFPALADTSG